MISVDIHCNLYRNKRNSGTIYMKTISSRTATQHLTQTLRYYRMVKRKILIIPLPTVGTLVRM